MKKINKKEPDLYKDYIANKNPKKWSDLGYEIRTEIRKYMLNSEQNNQCAYTEKYITSERKTVAKQIKSMYDQFSLNEIVSIIGKFESFITTIYSHLKNNLSPE